MRRCRSSSSSSSPLSSPTGRWWTDGARKFTAAEDGSPSAEIAFDAPTSCLVYAWCSDLEHGSLMSSLMSSLMRPSRSSHVPPPMGLRAACLAGSRACGRLSAARVTIKSPLPMRPSLTAAPGRTGIRAYPTSTNETIASTAGFKKRRWATPTRSSCTGHASTWRSPTCLARSVRTKAAASPPPFRIRYSPFRSSPFRSVPLSLPRMQYHTSC